MKFFFLLMSFSSFLVKSQDFAPNYNRLVSVGDVTVNSRGLDQYDAKKWDVKTNKGSKTFTFITDDPSKYLGLESLAENNKIKRLTEIQSKGELHQGDKSSPGFYSYDTYTFNDKGEATSSTRCTDHYEEHSRLQPNERDTNCTTVTPVACSELGSNYKKINEMLEACKEINRHSIFLDSFKSDEFLLLEKSNIEYIKGKALKINPRTSTYVKDKKTVQGTKEAISNSRKLSGTELDFDIFGRARKMKIEDMIELCGNLKSANLLSKEVIIKGKESTFQRKLDKVISN